MGLKIKGGAQGEIECFKARYVAKGFEQVYGADFFEAWAPVGRYATLPALFSVCVVWDLETKHIDIKCAFLKGMSHQDVYIVQPPILHDGTRVWRLKKALYGLKQARMLGVCMYGDQCRCYGRCVGGKVIRVQADCLY